MSAPSPSSRLGLLWLVVGVGLSYFVGWDPNWLIMTWIAPVFLLRFSRQTRRWWMVLLLLLPLLAVVNWFTVRGAWHMGPAIEVAFSMVMALPLVVSAVADRLLSPRLAPLPRTLVFPAVWALMDFLYSFLYGLGDVFSPALTQFHLPPIMQIGSLAGIYGITFLIGWFGSTAATVWIDHGDLSKWKWPAMATSAALLLALVYGSARVSGLDHDNSTVRVASITVPHARNYWEEIIDLGTPSSEAHRFRDELRQLEDRLFVETEKALATNAKIVFWAEAAAVMYQDREAAFLQRGAAFAREHGIYLQTASLVMRYDDEMIDNQITLFTPTGEVAYTYLKSQTWYPTESDFVIHSADTPYGRISSVICFDLDVPGWMQQVARMDVDILLVPGFDTRPISPYHTEAGLIRAVEGGYSIVRGALESTSIAVDYTGRTLALQDSFRTDQTFMVADVPTQGVTTLYGLLGDWFVGVVGLLLAGLLLAGLLPAAISPNFRFRIWT